MYDARFRSSSEAVTTNLGLHMALVAAISVLVCFAVACDPEEKGSKSDDGPMSEPAAGPIESETKPGVDSSDDTGPGPGPIGSGKIKKPGSAGSDYTIIIDRALVTEDKAGTDWLLHEDLINSDIDLFNATYAHSSGSGTYDIASTTLKIDNDRDGTFDPADEVELKIERDSTCSAGTCLKWTDLSSGTVFTPCAELAGGTYPQCVKSGIPPQFFGLPVAESWSVTKLNSGDPDPNASGDPVEAVGFYFK